MLGVMPSYDDEFSTESPSHFQDNAIGSLTSYDSRSDDKPYQPQSLQHETSNPEWFRSPSKSVFTPELMGLVSLNTFPAAFSASPASASDSLSSPNLAARSQSFSHIAYPHPFKLEAQDQGPRTRAESLTSPPTNGFCDNGSVQPQRISNLDFRAHPDIFTTLNPAYLPNLEAQGPSAIDTHVGLQYGEEWQKLQNLVSEDIRPMLEPLPPQTPVLSKYNQPRKDNSQNLQFEGLLERSFPGLLSLENRQQSYQTSQMHFRESFD